MQHEVSNKFAGMKDITKCIAGHFLCRPNIDLKPQLLILRMLVLSRGLFQAGSWPFLCSAEFGRLHSQIISICSIIDAKAPLARRRSHASLLSFEGVVPPLS